MCTGCLSNYQLGLDRPDSWNFPPCYKRHTIFTCCSFLCGIYDCIDLGSRWSLSCLGCTATLRWAGVYMCCMMRSQATPRKSRTMAFNSCPSPVSSWWSRRLELVVVTLFILILVLNLEDSYTHEQSISAHLFMRWIGYMKHKKLSPRANGTMTKGRNVFP